MIKSRFPIVLSIAVILITACAPQVTKKDEPVTLRLAVADEEGDPSAPYVHEFAEQVKTLSNGNITIEPTWDAGSATEAGFEIGVIQLVREGKFDLGLAASRAFDNKNITSFQALQAPFLIDNDALAIAVAQSNIARRMLESLSSSGLAGLTLWPEDLRHPFSLIPGKPLLSPGDFAGLNIRITPSSISNTMVEALGGKPMFEDSGYEGAESGLLQGAHLAGAPTATGNVTFFAKYQVLFANGPAFEKLSETQRKVLRDAAIATQKKAISEHPSEVDAAKAWCADGGSVVLASDEQVAAFEKAAQPILDSMAKDSLNVELIAAIRDLKANTEPSPAVEACNGAVAQDSPLNGTWDYVVSDKNGQQFFLNDYRVTADEIRVRLGFNNNQWWQAAVFDGKPFEGDGGTFHIEGDRLIQVGNHGKTQVTYIWVLNGDQLTLTVVQECDVTSTGLNCRDDRSQMDPIMIMITEHTYIKSGNDGSY